MNHADEVEDDTEQTESEFDEEEHQTNITDEENRRRSDAAAQLVALAGSDNAVPFPDQSQHSRPVARMAANLNIGNSSTTTTTLALRKVIRGRIAGENESMDTSDPQGPIYDNIPASKASTASTSL